MTTRFIALIAFLTLSLAARAATVSLQASADGGMREWVPTELGGGSPNYRVGTLDTTRGGATRNRIVIQFDVASALPAGATITAVQLRVNVLRAVDTESRLFHLRRVLVPWTEPAVSWETRDAPSIAWGAAGGLIETDYADTSSGVTMLGNPSAWDVPTPFTWISTPEMVANAQAWLDNPAANFGWIIMLDDEATARTARLLASREHNDIDGGTNGRPRLEVTFTAPLRIDSVSLLEGNFCLFFNGKAGKAYTVEHRLNADAGMWTTLTNFPTRAFDGSLVACDPITAPRRFYRIEETP